MCFRIPDPFQNLCHASPSTQPFDVRIATRRHIYDHPEKMKWVESHIRSNPIKIHFVPDLQSYQLYKQKNYSFFSLLSSIFSSWCSSPFIAFQVRLNCMFIFFTIVDRLNDASITHKNIAGRSHLHDLPHTRMVPDLQSYRIFPFVVYFLENKIIMAFSPVDSDPFSFGLPSLMFFGIIDPFYRHETCDFNMGFSRWR